MWHDRWLALGVIAAALTCLACLTPIAVVALGAIGLSACAARLDAVPPPVFLVFLGLVVYRYWKVCRSGHGNSAHDA